MRSSRLKASRRKAARFTFFSIRTLACCVAIAGQACRSTDAPAPSASGGACSTPAVEDLYPTARFGTDEPDPGVTMGEVFEDGQIQGEAGSGSTPPLVGSSGSSGNFFGDGGPDLDGAPPITGDNGAVPAPLLTRLPNEYGRGANEIMPGADLTIFKDSDGHPALGKNGRHCSTCHADEEQWASRPTGFQGRFDTGLDQDGGKYAVNASASGNDAMQPIFRTVDGSNSPRADVSTPAARSAAYSMLLERAVIRIGLPVPSDADFELQAVDDPYQFASKDELSLFRRSPVMANLRFNTTLMWDGRETPPCATLTDDLRQQAKHAITGHAQGDDPSQAALEALVRNELMIYFAQLDHNDAGPLNHDGAHGGPWWLAQAPFYLGINSFDQPDPRGHAYNSEIFSLYRAWRGLASGTAQDQARARIAEGERLFDTRPFTIVGVSGFNDELDRPQITATCGACHNTPTVGTNSEGRLMDIGVSDESQRSPDLPLYTFRHTSDGALLKTSDPGQALIAKRWATMNRFKVPSLRGLAGRAPYLHNGSAPSLEAVLDYHDQRFGMQLSTEEKAAFVAFLSAL